MSFYVSSITELSCLKKRGKLPYRGLSRFKLTSRNFKGDFRWKFQWNFVMKFHEISSESFKRISRHLKFHPRISWFSLKDSLKLLENLFEFHLKISSDFGQIWNSIVVNMGVLATSLKSNLRFSAEPQLSLLKYHEWMNASGLELSEGVSIKISYGQSPSPILRRI